MQENSIFVSEAGLKKMREELDFLKTVRRKEIADRIEKAKELGDIKENAEYDDAKDELGMVMGRISVLENQISLAKVVDMTGSSGAVGIGSKVRVAYGEKEKVLTIVGGTEADPVRGLISNVSPLGKELIGKSVGEQVSVDVPAGKITYKIQEIS